MRKTIHKLETVALAVFLCFVGVAASDAMPLQAADQDDDTTRAQIANFDQFLDTHPATAADIQKNPSLLNDEIYVKNHAALAGYFHNHPQVRAELQENPRSFMNPERRFDQKEPREPGKLEGNVAGFDREFLD